jgi:2-polyprenyl-3-methyl-5-hydroxy-6-metoxy-1,4-benzoquinol methylase
MNNDLVAYYAERAKEYEKIYEKPERQSDLESASELLKTLFTGKDVFEIACGTGYWTQRIATTANSVVATDINDSVIDIAKTKTYGKSNVNFGIADIYNYKGKKYDSLFAGFIWSHIKVQELTDFINTVYGFVNPGGLVVFMDNNFVSSSSIPVIHTDEQGNTYQERVLENGKKYSIIKNFPKENTFSNLLKDKVDDMKFISLKHYWLLCYNRK